MRRPDNSASQARLQWTAPEVQSETKRVFTAIRAAPPKVARRAVIETTLLNRRLNLAKSPRTNISVRPGAELSIILPVNCWPMVKSFVPTAKVAAAFKPTARLRIMI
jgi:hypothetical protein